MLETRKGTIACISADCKESFDLHAVLQLLAVVPTFVLRRQYSMPNRIGYAEDFQTAHRRLVERGMHPLKAARKLGNLSIEALAEATGVSRRTIIKIEHAQCSPQPGTRALLVTYFGMDAYALGLL
jgi:DNA-binding XRE family transcriptional regulator